MARIQTKSAAGASGSTGEAGASHPGGQTPAARTTAVRLLDAAEREFALRGLEAARLEDIAKRVGVTRPSLLHHFPSKEALYAAVVERAYERLRASLLETMGAGGPFVERLDATVGRYFDHLVEHPAPAQLLVREMLDAKGPGARLLREKVGPILDLVEAFVRSSVSELPSSADPRAAVVDLAAAVAVYVVAHDGRHALYGERGGAVAAARARYVALARRVVLELAPGRKAARG